MSDPKNESPGPSTQKTSRAKTPAEPTASSSETSSSGGGATTQQATAAVSSAVGEVRARLTMGEQIVFVAAAVIAVVAYLIWEFLLNYRILSDFTAVIAVLTVVAIWVHRWGHYDFGSAYRILVGALGLALALFAVVSLLAWLRVGGNSVDFLHLVGRLVYWVSGIAAGYGAWLVFRAREA